MHRWIYYSQQEGEEVWVTLWVKKEEEEGQGNGFGRWIGQRAIVSSIPQHMSAYNSLRILTLRFARFFFNLALLVGRV